MFLLRCTKSRAALRIQQIHLSGLPLLPAPHALISPMLHCSWQHLEAPRCLRHSSRVPLEQAC